MTSGTIKLYSAIITIISLIAIIVITTDNYPYLKSKDFVLNIANALFQIFLGVIIVNLLIEKALDKERTLLNNLEKERLEQQKRIEKNQWDNTIQPFLLREILNSALSAFNILDTCYTVSDGKLTVQWEQIDFKVFKKNILRFRREKQNYLMYLGWFIDKMSLTQTINYHKFEDKLDTLDYWLEVLKNEDEVDLDKIVKEDLSVGQVIIRINISIGKILEFVDGVLSDEQSKLYKNMAVEDYGIDKQLENIFKSYKLAFHDIEVNDLQQKDKKNELEWTLVYRIVNFFRAQRLYDEYNQSLNDSINRQSN